MMRQRITVPVLISLIFLFISGSVFALDFIEGSVFLQPGIGGWDGQWNTDVQLLSTDLGQNTGSSIYPVGLVGFGATIRPWTHGVWHQIPLGLTLGAGSWGGRIVSEGSSVADRTSSITFIGTELIALAGYRYTLAQGTRAEGELGADLRLGLGIIVSPLWTIEAWKDTSTINSFYVSASDKLYSLVGLAFSYSLPASSYFLAFVLSGDLGFSAFQGEKQTLMSRINLGLSLSRHFKLGDQAK